MAGTRLTLKKLAKKYGVDIKGATYTKVVQEIINENVARASKKMGNLSNRRMKQAFTDSVKDGIVTLPDYAIPNVTVRKGAEDGKMITDTLRDTLTRGLRKAITDNPNNTEKAIAQMQSYIKDTFTTYTTSHAKMIAVTEVRSSVDLSKAEYVRELIARNPNRLRVTKKWVHNDHLVKTPRLTHKVINGEKVLFNQPFSIGLMYPHDPSAPASEVIGCQCGYQIEVEEMAINEAWKALYQNLKVYKAYRVGTRRQRADGYVYEKQTDGSWLRVKEQKNGLYGEQGTDNQGQSAGGQGNNRRISRQPSIQGMDTGLSSTENNRSDRGVGSVGNKAMERWVAIDDFRTKFGESPTRVFDNGVIETNNKELFSKQFMNLRNENPLGLKVSARKPHDLRGAKMFMTPDGGYTCAVTRDGVLTAVCSTVHKGDYDFTDHSLKPLLKQAIQSGARKADCYGKDLLNLYKTLGYKVVGQANWNPKYWNEKKDNSPQNETDPMKVFPEEKGEPKYYYLALTDKTPEIQDVSDWDWEDIEKLQNSFTRKSPVEKASASINPATGKPYQIGETKVRPDGSKWVKTGTFSWAKAGTKDAEEAKKKTDTDGDGKAEKKEIEGQSSKDAEDILSVYGEKGLYQLTKAGMYNLLLAHGVDDPKSLKWAEKVEKVKEITKEIKTQVKKVEIKTQGKEEFTKEDYHILHNNDLIGDASSLENTTLHTRNGGVTLKFTKDGGLSDETYDELMQKVDPIEGGHWGSAKTDNDVALSVALVNAPDWKPIDRMQNGMLAKHDQQLSDTMYEHCLVKGIGLRKHAQEALKHPDMSRENIPNFFRGMTVDASQYEQILAGEVDTIELTGCTAVTSFEAVADQYASSQWTKGFGADRRSIKLVIERDDYMDNSIGMFHHNTKGYAHGNRNIGFELLTGSPSFYIKSVQKGEDFDIDKSANIFMDKNVSYDRDAKDLYSKIKDVDLVKIYDPTNYWKYTIRDDNGRGIMHANDYRTAIDRITQIKAQAEVQDLNNKIEAWEKQFYKDNIQDFFSKIKNGRISHKNNDKIKEEWEKKVEEAWQKSDLYKQCSDIKDTAPSVYPIDRSSFRYINLPDEAERKKIDQIYSNPKLIDYYKSQRILDPTYDLAIYKMTEQFDKWREAQNSKKGTLTMKMFLDKRKPLEKSYKTQIDKTEKEYQDFDGFYKWRDQVMGELPQAKERIASEIQQRYGLTDEEMTEIVSRKSNGEVFGFYSYHLPNRLPEHKKEELRDYIRKINGSEPKLTPYGIIYNRGGGYFDPIDNPFIPNELKNSPYFTRSDEYSDKRYEQLANMRKNYENAKRENELIAKYDIYNTPNTTFTKMYSDTFNTLKEIRDRQKDYLVDKYNELSSSNLNQSVLDGLKENYKKGLIATPIREQIEKIRDKLVDDKEYSSLTQELTKAEEKYKELGEVSNIYRDYVSKLADMHKSSRPLEVHVVCGRGKKSMTAGADDQLEEQDDGNN